MRKLWLSLLIFFPSLSWAAPSPETGLKTGRLKIYAYGSGDILAQVFNGVASIFRDSTGEYNIVIGIAVHLGLLYAIILAMNKMGLTPLWKDWLIPTFLTLSLFTVTSEKVIIYDHLIRTDNKPKTITVDHVPLLLAYSAHFFSSLSYGLTSLLEKHAHATDDEIYNWTGHIYAGQSLYNTRKMRLIDGITEENFREFCRECVFRDLGLGLYTRSELEKAPDLLAFLEKRTSKIRGVNYRQPINIFNYKESQDIGESQLPLLPGTREGVSKARPGSMSLISCTEAISNIRRQLKGELANSKSILFGAIGSGYQHLIHQSENAPIQELIQQQIAIDTLKEYAVGHQETLASKIAEQTQISYGKALSWTASWIVDLRSYVEALCYLVFPLIVIISLCFLGYKVFLGWGQILCWINFWPPCYVCANFLLQNKWKKAMIANGFAGEAYNLFMSEGLFQHYSRMESIACGIFISIPCISWGLLFLSKGGASALMNWASSFTQSAKGIASSTASNEVTGNYSYQNVGLSSRSLGNTTTFQQNTSPLFMGGSIATQDNQGKITTSLSGENMTLDERKSNLLTDISNSEAFTNSIQSHLREAESITQGESMNVSKSIAHTANAAQGLSKHFSASSSQSEGWEDLKLSSMQRQAQEVYTKAEEYGKTHSMDTAHVFDEALKMGAGWGIGLKAGIDGSLSNRFSESEGEQKSERLSDALSIYEGLQNLAQTVHREGGSFAQEEGFRDYRDFADSFNQTENSARQLSAAYSTQQTLENLESGIKSKDLRVSHNLNNAFMAHLEESFGDKDRIQQVLIQPELRQREVDRFIQNLTPKTSLEAVDLQTLYCQEASAVEGSQAPLWQNAIVTAREAKVSWQEGMHKDSPTVFEGTQNLKRLNAVRQDGFGGFNSPDLSQASDKPALIEHFEKLEQRADSIAPKGYDARDSQSSGGFNQSKDQFEKTSAPNFLLKASQHSVLCTAVKKAGQLLGFPEAQNGNAISTTPYDAGLPGWDALTDEQKLAVMDSRTSDYFP